MDRNVKEYTYEGTKKQIKAAYLNEIDKNIYGLGNIGIQVDIVIVGMIFQVVSEHQRGLYL